MNAETKRFWIEEKKNNRRDIFAGVLLVVALLMSVVEIISEPTESRGWILVTCGLCIGVLVPYRYLVKYLRDDADSEAGVFDKNRYIPLYQIARFNSFDVDTYFWLMLKNYLPLYLFGVAVNVFGLFRDSDIYSIASLAASAILPIVVFGLGKALFVRNITHENGIGKNLSGILLSALMNFAALFILFVFTVVVVIIGYSVVVDRIAGYGNLANAQMIVYTWFNNVWLMCGVICILLALLLNRPKKLGRIPFRPLMIVLGVLSLMFVVIADIYCNNTIDEEGVVVKCFGEETAYSFDDVKDYVIFEEDGELNIKATFGDGETVKLMGSTFSTTDSWSEKYSDKDAFLAVLVNNLRERGVEGSFADEWAKTAFEELNK